MKIFNPPETPDGTAAVELKNVSLRYDDGPDVLSALNLALPPGSFHFLTGPSGAGKTSLLKLLYLAQRPTMGSVHLFGTDLTAAARRSLPAIRRKVGVVFQDFRLLDHLSVFDNVALPLRVAAAAEPEIKSNVTELLSWVGLDDFMDAKPAVLSGGQKQRVAIARAVVNRPRLILADEPTGSVDDVIAMRLMQLFIELNKLGSNIIIATHNEQLVARFGYSRLALADSALTELPPLSDGNAAEYDQTINEPQA
ncbi:MAG: cell division ATP-binding protein FtsE [Rhodospirillaceae bacterium]